MSRLIDIDKRMEEWNELLKASYPNLPCQMFHHFLLSAPAVDAVPVVRCRECRKRGNERECPMCHEEFDGCDYCTIDYTSDDGFCHMGKKMDAKEEQQ